MEKKKKQSTKHKIETVAELESILNLYLENDIPLSLLDENYEINTKFRGVMVNRILDYSLTSDNMHDIYGNQEGFRTSNNIVFMDHTIKGQKKLKHSQLVQLLSRKKEIQEEMFSIERNAKVESEEIRKVDELIKTLDQVQIKAALSVKSDIGSLEDSDDSIIDVSDENNYLIDKFNLTEEEAQEVLSTYRKYQNLLNTKKELIKNYLIENDSKYSSLVSEFNSIHEKIFICNVNLCNWIIRKWFKYVPCEYEDMQSIAFEGLLKAIDNYDPNKGELSTYASIVIRHHIQRNFKELIGIDWNSYVLACKYSSYERQIKELMPDVDKITPELIYESNLFGETLSTLRRAKTIGNYVTIPFTYVLPEELIDRKNSLTTLEDYEEQDEVENIQADILHNKTDEDFVFDDVSYSALKESLKEVLDTLTERERFVLEQRFGLSGGRAKTLEEVGKELNVTRERVRQAEAKALRKLRHPSRYRKVRDYVDLTDRYKSDSVVLSAPVRTSSSVQFGTGDTLSYQESNILFERELNSIIKYMSDNRTLYFDCPNYRRKQMIKEIFEYLQKAADNECDIKTMQFIINKKWNVALSPYSITLFIDNVKPIMDEVNKKTEYIHR